MMTDIESRPDAESIARSAVRRAPADAFSTAEDARPLTLSPTLLDAVAVLRATGTNAFDTSHAVLLGNSLIPDAAIFDSRRSRR